MAYLILSLDLPYPPSGNKTIRHERGRHHRTLEYEKFIQDVALTVLLDCKLPEAINYPVSVYYTAYPPDARMRDADNIIKPLNDALTYSGVWENDSNRVVRNINFSWENKIRFGMINVKIYKLDTWDRIVRAWGKVAMSWKMVRKT